MPTITLSNTKEFTLDENYDVYITDGTEDGSIYRPWPGDPHNLECEGIDPAISEETAKEVLSIHREMERLFRKAQELLRADLPQVVVAVTA